MNRRQLLLTGSAAAFAAMLPIHAVAAIPTYPQFDSLVIEKLGLIEQALDVGELYEFDFATRVTLFGFEPHSIETHAELREVVQTLLIDYGNVDVWNRVRLIVAIREELDRRIPGDILAQLRFIDRPPDRFGRVSVRERMSTTQFADLHDAARLIGCYVPPHGLAEMRNFIG